MNIGACGLILQIECKKDDHHAMRDELRVVLADSCVCRPEEQHRIYAGWLLVYNAGIESLPQHASQPMKSAQLPVQFALQSPQDSTCLGSPEIVVAFRISSGHLWPFQQCLSYLTLMSLLTHLERRSGDKSAFDSGLGLAVDPSAMATLLRFCIESSATAERHLKDPSCRDSCVFGLHSHS